MYEAMDIRSYRYIVMLRKSKDRYYSHYRNVVRQQNLSNESFVNWSNRQPDSWNLRKICGTLCMNVPKYQITERLFNYTLDRIRTFDDILFLERFNESYTKFANRVGWKRMALPRAVDDHDDSAMPGRGDPGHVLSSTSAAADMETWEPLMTALDDALYEYAQDLYSGVAIPKLSPQQLDAVKMYFNDGVKRNCVYPCCHDECSTY